MIQLATLIVLSSLTVFSQSSETILAPVMNSMVDIATVYDSSWLAQLWPRIRNGVHISLETSCWRNITVFLQDLADGRAYAMAAVDATGSVGTGLLWGNAIWPGSHQECKDLDDRFLDFITNSSGRALTVRQYANWITRQNMENLGRIQTTPQLLELSEMSLLDRTPPFRMSFYEVVMALNITKVTIKNNQYVRFGLCLPRACSSEDIQQFVEFSMRTYRDLKISNALPRNTKVLSVRSIDEQYSFFGDPKFRILLFTTIIFTLLTIVGTFVHLHKLKRDLKKKIVLPKFQSFLNIDQPDLFLKRNEPPEVPIFNGIIPTMNLFPDMNHKNEINVVTVKKIINKDSNPSVALDIIATRTSSPGSEILPEFKNVRLKKSKYQVSQANTLFIDRRHMRDFLLVFSAKTNIEKLFQMDVGEGSLPVVHGAKVLMMLWIMLAHTALIIYYLSDNQLYRGKMESGFLYQSVASATYSVDTFFVLSGTLVSYLYNETLRKYKHSKERERFDGFLGKIAQFTLMVLYRYLRLTPPYLAIIMMVEVSSRYFRSYSFLLQPGDNDSNCEKFWWRNILYVNTFYPVKEMCLTWSWYLSIDTQLYLIGSIVLVISSKHPKSAAALISILIFSSLSTVGLTSLRSGFLASSEHPFANYDDIYDKPWMRVAPYFIGICTGWFLSKRKCFLDIPKNISTVFWFLTIMAFLTIIYGLQIVRLGPQGSIIYSILSHPVWGLGVSWVLIACSTGQGYLLDRMLSWKVLYSFSRLSYCAYLLHPALLHALLASNGTPQHLTISNVILSFLGSSTAVFLMSFIISMLFEAPVVSLLRLVISGRRFTNKL